MMMMILTERLTRFFLRRPLFSPPDVVIKVLRPRQVMAD